MLRYLLSDYLCLYEISLEEKTRGGLDPTIDLLRLQQSHIFM